MFHNFDCYDAHGVIIGTAFLFFFCFWNFKTSVLIITKLLFCPLCGFIFWLCCNYAINLSFLYCMTTVSINCFFDKNQFFMIISQMTEKIPIYSSLSHTHTQTDIHGHTDSTTYVTEDWKADFTLDISSENWLQILPFTRMYGSETNDWK